jgi:methyltransferase (TIGR00027 family)
MDRPVTPHGNGDAEVRLVERFPPRGAPNLSDWLERRTRWFDGVTLKLLDAGIRQVVIVAAGYDCRALRFRTPGVRFVELDHPATQADKRRILGELGVDTSDVAYAAADFTVDDVGAALAAAGHDPAAPTLFLVEGLLVYLDEDVIASLLRALRTAAADGSRLAVSMSRTQRTSFMERVAAVGEPARTFFDEEQAAAMLRSCGWEGDTTRVVVLATPAPMPD